MNRFEYVEARLHEHETFVSKGSQMKLYDGEQKVSQTNKLTLYYYDSFLAVFYRPNLKTET